MLKLKYLLSFFCVAVCIVSTIGICQSSENSNAELKGAADLHSMSRHGELEILEKIIAKGVDVNTQDDDGKTPLHLALDIETADLLIAAGANPDILDNNGNSILHYAAYRGATDILENWAQDTILLEHKNNAGRTALMSAIRANQKESVKVLLQAGAIFNARDSFGLFPLHYATKKDSPEIVKLLVEAGANIDCTDNDNSTPLHYAANYGDNRVLPVLIKLGADTQALMIAGDGIKLRPIEIAIAAGNEVAIDMLNK